MKINMTTKDGLTLLTKGKYCTEDIEVTPTFETGGGGATVETAGGWQGTTVPNSGLVETLYFNNNLSYQEVNEIIDLAELTWLYGAFYFIGCINVDSKEQTLRITKAEDGYGIVFEDTIIFNGSLKAQEQAGFIGWNEEVFTTLGGNSFPLGLEVITESATYGKVGLENEKLSSIVSTTQFVEETGKTITLSGVYDGSIFNITKNDIYDVETLLNAKKLPLIVNVKIPDLLEELINGTIEEVPQETTKDMFSINDYAFYRCEQLKQIDTSGMVYVGKYAFAYCKALTSINLPICWQINEFAFYECQSLTEITLQHTSLEEIKEHTFYNCKSLTSIVIPSGVKTIGDNAFDDCTSMQLYDFRSATAVPTLGSSVFRNIPSTCKIVVPASLYDEWIAATNWSEYASYIVKASEYTEA